VQGFNDVAYHSALRWCLELGSIVSWVVLFLFCCLVPQFDLRQAMEAPFTDADGARLMAALRFDADNTIAGRPMVDMLTQVAHMLDVARARAGSGARCQAATHAPLICLAAGLVLCRDVSELQ